MKTQISILFDAYHLYHLAQFEPLMALLEKDDRFDVYYSTSSENRKEEIELCSSVLLKRRGKFVFHKDENIRCEKIKDIGLDVFICGWSRYDIDSYVNDNTVVAMIYHGIGVKPSYWNDNHSRLDLRFVEGEYRINQLRENGVSTDLSLTGYIKLDPLFNNESSYFEDKKIETNDSICSHFLP